MKIKSQLQTSRFVRTEYAVISGVVLCTASYSMDFVLGRFGTRASETMMNDAAMGVLGALTAFFFLSASQQKQQYEDAKERMRLIAELNSRVREAFGQVAVSALSDDRGCRLQGIDEASQRIDVILAECMNFPRNGAQSGRNTTAAGA